MLQDLSHIALKYAQSAVHQRLTLKPNAKGENRAPVVFQYDSGGDYLPWAVKLLQAATGGRKTSSPKSNRSTTSKKSTTGRRLAPLASPRPPPLPVGVLRAT